MLSDLGTHSVARNAYWYLALVLLILGALSCAQGFVNAVKPAGSQDFQWSPSRYLLQHKNPYQLYLAHRAGELKDNPFPLSQVPNYPASALLALWPLAALDLDTAKWLWAAANVLMGVGCVFLLARTTGANMVAALGLLGLFFMSTPVRNSIGNGQQGLFSLFFFLLAVHFQIGKRTPLAAVCLAACWLKFTITFPLSLVFIRREWRMTLLIAAGIHIALTLFLSFWTSESPVGLLMGPLTVSETGVDSTMFDTMAVANYFGAESRLAGAIMGIAILAVAAWVIASSKRNLPTDLALASFVSVVWSHHASYDYLVLIIPLMLVVRHWTQESIGSIDILTISGVLLIWFVLRLLDAAISLFPSHAALALTALILFWAAGATVYAALAVALATVYRQGRRETRHHQNAASRDAKATITAAAIATSQDTQSRDA